MTATADIRTAIVNVLEGVADVGRVHAYERYSTNTRELKALYLSDEHDQLRGWFVRRRQIREVGQHMPSSVEYQRWQIRGFIALSDEGASELLCDSLIDDIRAAFDADQELGGAVASICMPNGAEEAGIQLVDFGPVMFAGVLCHGIVLELNTYQHLS